jgi:hypothetical protein
MSIEQDSKALVSRWYGLLNKNDLLIEEVVTPPASSFVDRRGMPDVTGLTSVRPVET